MPASTQRRPHVVFIFADEWRAQATPYAGDPNVHMPHLSRLREQSLNCSHAIAGSPVCCPYRASLMTGQHALTHGVFVNDVELNPHCNSIAKAFSAGGYRTGYIGKWHIYGSPEGNYERRAAPVPREYQLGFDDWWGFECTHNYWKSPYYHNDDPTQHMWEGYDAFAQSEHAAAYIEEHADDADPFMLMLSWGPPHFPLHTAPDEYKALYADGVREIELHPNVPDEDREKAISALRGYYAHLAALDDALATVLAALDKAGIADNTLLVVTSDHGEMAYSQGLPTKLHPFAESLRVPFLLRWPEGVGRADETCEVPLDAPDIMPTLLDLCRLDCPDSVEGQSRAAWIRGEHEVTGEETAFIQMPARFTEMLMFDMPEHRGVFTHDHTYVQTREGPWLLFDHETDPYQLNNLAGQPEAAAVQTRLAEQLQNWLDQQGDQFEASDVYLKRFGYDHMKETKAETFPAGRNWRIPGG